MQYSENRKIIKDNNSSLEISFITDIGDRDEQQDSFGYDFKSECSLAIVCDGMGGYEGGKLASSIAVETFLSEFDKSFPMDDVVSFMKDATFKANQEVHDIRGSDGIPLRCGSTMVAILVVGREMYWNSVGDSRAYLLRDGQLAQFTVDHNYGTVLQEQVNASVISNEQYEKEMDRSGALISYLGMDVLPLIDYNKNPILLKSEDRIIMMSDGLYKLLSDYEIKMIVENFSNVEDAVNALENKAKRRAANNQISRDNMTIGLIKIVH